MCGHPVRGYFEISVFEISKVDFTFFCVTAQSATSSTRLCQKGGVPLDVQGEGPTQRTLRAERESLDVQELPTDFKRHPKVK